MIYFVERFILKYITITDYYLKRYALFSIKTLKLSTDESSYDLDTEEITTVVENDASNKEILVSLRTLKKALRDSRRLEKTKPMSDGEKYYGRKYEVSRKIENTLEELSRKTLWTLGQSGSIAFNIEAGTEF